MFPDTPQVSDNSTRRDTVYVNASPEGIIYVSEAVYAKRNLKEILMSHFQDSIYATVLRTTLNAPKYKLLYKKNIASNNLYGLEFGYKALVKGRIYYGYNQVFYFNNVLINNSLWSPDSLTGERKPLKDFFGSFKLTIKKENIRQNNGSVLAVAVEYGITIFIIFGLILALIVFLIKRKSKTNTVI